jgi:hypothetical protein
MGRIQKPTDGAVNGEIPERGGVAGRWGIHGLAGAAVAIDPVGPYFLAGLGYGN